MSDSVDVSVILPCLNEEQSLGSCLQKINSVLASTRIAGEVIVCDNGSTDSSVKIAREFGAQVVNEPLRGYGNACRAGFAKAQGRFIIMGDADDTYDFAEIPKILKLLKDDDFEFVSGSRFLQAGAAKNMALSHRLIGNPLLTKTINLLFRTHYTDVYCGLRGFQRNSYSKLPVKSGGMEFNLELAIYSGILGLRTCEIPIRLGLRKGKSKLNTVWDGLRSFFLIGRLYLKKMPFERSKKTIT